MHHVLDPCKDAKCMQMTVFWHAASQCLDESPVDEVSALHTEWPFKPLNTQEVFSYIGDVHNLRDAAISVLLRELQYVGGRRCRRQLADGIV